MSYFPLFESKELISSYITNHIYLYVDLSRSHSYNSIQILTAHEDDGGNYHSQGGVHTGPSITPEAKPRGDRRAGMNTTEGVIISATIRLQSSPYLFYIPHPFHCFMYKTGLENQSYIKSL